MASSSDDNLLFAVPKKGRLHDKILKLLEGAGLEYYRVRAPVCVLLYDTRTDSSLYHRTVYCSPAAWTLRSARACR